MAGKRTIESVWRLRAVGGLRAVKMFSWLRSQLRHQ